MISLDFGIEMIIAIIFRCDKNFEKRILNSFAKSTTQIILIILIILIISLIIRFDWNSEEKLLNSFAQFTTEISGLQVHFIRALPKPKKGQVNSCLCINRLMLSVKYSLWQSGHGILSGQSSAPTSQYPKGNYATIY